MMCFDLCDLFEKRCRLRVAFFFRLFAESRIHLSCLVVLAVCGLLQIRGGVAYTA
jgi:hypothetical protein